MKIQIEKVADNLQTGQKEARVKFDFDGQSISLTVPLKSPPTNMDRIVQEIHDFLKRLGKELAESVVKPMTN